MPTQGDWHRQVSLLGTESIAKIIAAGMDVHPGDFAENVTTTGIRLWELPIGTQLQLGDAVQARSNPDWQNLSSSLQKSSSRSAIA